MGIRDEGKRCVSEKEQSEDYKRFLDYIAHWG
jgi:hypothetical protein